MIDAARSLVPTRRHLTDHERRALRARIRRLTANQRRTSMVYLPIGAGVIFVLWLWTMLASDAPWLVITGFWLVARGGIVLWVRRDMLSHARQLTDIAQTLKSSLRRGEADVYDIHATAFAVLEEIEDEGACYAFAVDGNRLVFVAGQEFYEAARFPSLDFSLVYPLDEHGNAVDMLIEKRGEKAIAARRIAATDKRKLRAPEHLEVRMAGIDDIERLLAGDVSH